MVNCYKYKELFKAPTDFLNKVFGQKTVETPGSPTAVGSKLQEIGKTTTPIEKLGGAALDTLEFFLPGAAEVKTTEAWSKLIDSANFAEKFGSKAGPVISNLLKIVAGGTTTGASTELVSQAQQGGKAGLTPGIIGGIAGAAGKAFEIFGPNILTQLNKSGFKLSPTQEVKVGQKAEEAAGFMANNNITGSSALKYKQLSNINDDLETALQNSVGTKVSVNKQELIDEINKNVEQFRKTDPAVYKSAHNDAKNAIDVIKSTPGNTIDTNNLLIGKRSYGKSAFGKATAQVKGSVVNSEGDYAIEQAYYSTLGNAMKNSNTKVQIPSN